MTNRNGFRGIPPLEAVRMRRILLLTLIVLCCIPVLPVSAPGTTPTLNAELKPGEGTVYDYIVVVGNGATAGADIKVFWDEIVEWNGENGLLTTTEAYPDGSFETYFYVPMCDYGIHYVWVKDYSTHTVKNIVFEVHPIVVLATSDEGPTGTVVTLSGSGYTPYGEWDLWFGEIYIGIFDVDSDGTILGSYIVPDTEVGTYTVAVRDCYKEVEVTLEFTVTARPYVEIDPLSAPWGTIVSVHGCNFAAYGENEVGFWLFDDYYEYVLEVLQEDEGWYPVLTNGDGCFEAWFTVPEYEKGNYGVWVQDSQGFSYETDFNIEGAVSASLVSAVEDVGSKVEYIQSVAEDAGSMLVEAFQTADSFSDMVNDLKSEAKDALLMIEEFKDVLESYDDDTIEEIASEAISSLEYILTVSNSTGDLSGYVEEALYEASGYLSSIQAIAEEAHDLAEGVSTTDIMSASGVETVASSVTAAKNAIIEEYEKMMDAVESVLSAESYAEEVYHGVVDTEEQVSSYIGQVNNRITTLANMVTLVVLSEHGETYGAGQYLRNSEASFGVHDDVENYSSGTRYLFQSWICGSGEGYSGSSYAAEITMTSDIVEKAQWSRQFLLRVDSDVDVDGAGWHDEGTMVKLEVRPSVGGLVKMVFTGWTGDIESTSDMVHVMMDEPKVVTANWKSDYGQLYAILGFAVAAVGVTGAISMSRSRNERARLAEMRLRDEFFDELIDAADVIYIQDAARAYSATEEKIRELIDEAVRDGRVNGSNTRDGSGFITQDALRSRIRRSLEMPLEEPEVFEKPIA